MAHGRNAKEVRLIFPDGNEEVLSMSYSDANSICVGDALVVGGQSNYYRIKDVQHQVVNEAKGFSGFVYIMTLLILEIAEQNA